MAGRQFTHNVYYADASRAVGLFPLRIIAALFSFANHNTLPQRRAGAARSADRRRVFWRNHEA